MDIPTDPMHGQLWPKERELLHRMVLEKRPNFVFEVGTWRGGGSTYQIASALRKLGNGRLLTCEPDRRFYEEANYYYSDWEDYVTILNQSSTEVIASFLDEQRYPDFVFFDGPDYAGLALRDFQSLDPYLVNDTYFMMHDWDANKGILLRPFLEKNAHWSIKHALTQPESVGLVVAVKNQVTIQ